MIPNRFRIIYEVTRKEILEHFKTKRLLVIAIVFTAVFLIVAVLGNYLVGGAGGDEPAYEQGPNTVLLLMISFTALFPPIIAIALGYDSIVGERTRRSLHLILSKPVDRSSIFIGKFLSIFLSIVIIYLIVGTIGYILVIVLSGQIPSLEEVSRAYAAIGLILFSAGCWVLFIMLFSTSFKTVTSTIIFSVLFWLFILNIISQSGFLYYMFTQEQAEEPITMDFNTYTTPELGINFTTLVFQPRGFTLKILELEYDVRYANGSKVERLEMPGRLIESSMPTYLIQEGEYTWTIRSQDDEDSIETVSSGYLRVERDFIPGINLLPTSSNGNGDGSYYNNFVLTIGSIDKNSNRTFDIFITNLENGDVIVGTLRSGRYLDLSTLNENKYFDEGDYRIVISYNDISYLNTTVHSYGKEEQVANVFAFSSEDEEYPSYVKFTAALNPDRCADASYEIITGEYTPMVFLTIYEAIIALTVMFIFLFLVGLLIFSRIELL